MNRQIHYLKQRCQRIVTLVQPMHQTAYTQQTAQRRQHLQAYSAEIHFISE